MSGLTPFTFKVGTNAYISLNLDKTIYDSDIATACGALSGDAPAGSAVVFQTQKLARRSGLVQVLRVGCVRGKKRRQITLICDKDKSAGIGAALKDKKVNLGRGAGVPWDIVTVGT
jgi:hypothetical protein